MERKEGNICEITEKSEDRENYGEVGSPYILIPTPDHLMFICIYLAS